MVMESISIQPIHQSHPNDKKVIQSPSSYDCSFNGLTVSTLSNGYITSGICITLVSSRYLSMDLLNTYVVGY